MATVSSKWERDTAPRAHMGRRSTGTVLWDEFLATEPSHASTGWHGVDVVAAELGFSERSVGRRTVASRHGSLPRMHDGVSEHAGSDLPGRRVDGQHVVEGERLTVHDAQVRAGVGLRVGVDDFAAPSPPDTTGPESDVSLRRLPRWGTQAAAGRR